MNNIVVSIDFGDKFNRKGSLNLISSLLKAKLRYIDVSTDNFSRKGSNFSLERLILSTKSENFRIKSKEKPPCSTEIGVFVKNSRDFKEKRRRGFNLRRISRVSRKIKEIFGNFLKEKKMGFQKENIEKYLDLCFY